MSIKMYALRTHGYLYPTNSGRLTNLGNAVNFGGGVFLTAAHLFTKLK